MKKSELKQLIKEELLKEVEVKKAKVLAKDIADDLIKKGFLNKEKNKNEFITAIASILIDLNI